MVPIRRVLQATVLAAALCAVASSGAGAATVVLDADQITDDAEVIGAADEERALEALGRLLDERAVQLWVVYVRTFDGSTPDAWAEAAALDNGLGAGDALLAIAIDDRQYAWSVDEDFPLDDAELARLATTAIEPRLRAGAWADASIAAADALRDSLAASGDTAGGSGAGWLLPAGLVAVPVGGFVVYRLVARRRRGPRSASSGASGAPPDPEAGLDEDELADRGSVLLVEADDAIATSAVDLAMAEVEFGAAAVAPYRAALDAARAEVAAAYRARISLAGQPDAAARRPLLLEVIAGARRADAALDAQAASFDALRDRANRAGEVVAGLTVTLAAAVERLSGVAPQLAQLRSTEPAGALGEVADNDDEARARIDFARVQLDAANESLARGDRNVAALAARAAEEALHQTSVLLDAVGQRGEALRAARAELPARVDSLRRDVVEAEALTGDAAATVRPATEAARAALAAIDAGGVAGVADPVASLARLGETEARLDEALAPVRDARERDERARERLTGALAQADARVRAVDDYIAVRRGGVGVAARTALADATAKLDEARRAATESPVAALDAAQRALARADEAGRLAERDLEAARRGPGAMPGRGGGVFGDLGGMVLGGVLVDSAARGRGGPRFPVPGPGGGNAGGAGRAPHGGGVASPGHFGGSGRRGGGGRF